MSKEIIEQLAEEQKGLTKLVKDFIGKFSKQKLKFGELMTTTGQTLSFDGETLTEGAAVMIDGAAAADGAYTLENGATCNVADGKVVSIVAAESGGDSDKFAALEKTIADKFAAFEAKYAERDTAFAGQFEDFGKVLLGITEQLGKQGELVGKFASQEPASTEPPANRKTQKIDKEIAAAKLVDQMLEEINKAKN